MTGSPDKDANMTTQNRTSHPARIAAVVIVTLVFAALVVCPGFIAGGLSRGSRPIVRLALLVQLSAGDVYPGPALESPAPSPSKIPILSNDPSGVFLCDRLPALHVIFIPAETVMRVFPRAFQFYFWEYYVAGGR